MRIATILTATALALTATALTATAAPALADTADMTVRQVRVSDLDLSTLAGRAALKTRVGRAVEAVCGSYATTAEPSTQDTITACRHQVSANIDQQIAARTASNSQLASR